MNFPTFTRASRFIEESTTLSSHGDATHSTTAGEIVRRTTISNIRADERDG
jgi:hypothetical protein